VSVNGVLYRPIETGAASERPELESLRAARFAARADRTDSTTGYCAGTLIRTDAGDIPVQRLAIGDRVITLSGAAEPIQWIGRRSYTVRFMRPSQRPIVFRAGSLGDGIPRRDLRVSPSHCMLMGGILVPAAALVNGLTIVRDKDCRRVDYVHVELAEHRAIWAEGALSETFVDEDQSRLMFHNASEFAELYPDAPRPSASCAPRVDRGYLLDVIRSGLAKRTMAVGFKSELAKLN
jgi:hypothetical protein